MQKIIIFLKEPFSNLMLTMGEIFFFKSAFPILSNRLHCQKNSVNDPGNFRAANIALFLPVMFLEFISILPEKFRNIACEILPQKRTETFLKNSESKKQKVNDRESGLILRSLVWKITPVQYKTYYKRGKNIIYVKKAVRMIAAKVFRKFIQSLFKNG